MSDRSGMRLSSLVREQVSGPSPIRQIMRLAERQNLVALGLDPDDVISFAGGWVNHPAPEPLRQAYVEIAADPALFHQSGGYTATLGDWECRAQLAQLEEHLFGVPRLGPAHIAVGLGSTQLTHDLLRTLLDPGDTVLLLDPTYAAYQTQLALAVPGARIVRLSVLDAQTWTYRPHTELDVVVAEFHRLFDKHQPRLVLFGAPDNPTSQVVPHALADAMAERTADAGAWLAIDYAYRCQLFQPPPLYFAWSPADQPHVIGIHSNSKWGRGLGRRLGWVVADPHVIAGLERVQQYSILCPDTLSQMAMTRYIPRAIADGSLRAYVEHANELYDAAARVAVEAIAEHVQRPHLVPEGGLYTVVDTGDNADAFATRALHEVGVVVVAGRGFGSSLATGIRISYGPLVMAHDRIREGIARLGQWMRPQ